MGGMLDVDLILPETPRPLRRVEYERLAELGFFGDERVELLHGVMVSRGPQGSRHAWVVQRLTNLLVRALAGRADVRPQLPLAASDDSEPEPDLAVVPLGTTPDAHPASALLVIEVADSSLRKDRLIKSRIYAAASVLEYWVVDLEGGELEVYTAPDHGEYRQIARHPRGATVSARAFCDIAVRVDDVIPA